VEFHIGKPRAGELREGSHQLQLRRHPRRYGFALRHEQDVLADHRRKAGSRTPQLPGLGGIDDTFAFPVYLRLAVGIRKSVGKSVSISFSVEITVHLTELVSIDIAIEVAISVCIPITISITFSWFFAYNDNNDNRKWFLDCSTKRDICYG
jgi:hypothetical protein